MRTPHPPGRQVPRGLHIRVIHPDLGTLARMGRTAQDPPAHGTRARYQYRGGECRCTLCRRANADYQADYRKPDAPWHQLQIPGT